MSQELIGRSDDLKRLRDEGYEIDIKNGYALVYNIPYVNSKCEIKHGTLVSTLTLAGNKTTKPDNHVIYFIGEHPCKKDGSIISGIVHETSNRTLAQELIINHSFSNKPTNGYSNYYEKFVRYIDIIIAPAKSLDNSVTAQTYNIIPSTDESVFNYYDTNTSRANIGLINNRLENQKIAIVGLGGTGSYILDLIAKTPVAEIHLFDGDTFLQHNAFRAPGAPTIEILDIKKLKVDYFSEIYKNMHKYVIPQKVYINIENINNLLQFDFVFICIDTSSIKKDIVELLVKNNIPFIDVGIGVEIVEESLLGTVRVTLSTPSKSDHLKEKISYIENDKEDAYITNIQIAELNSMNACLAVIKWKKFIGFYQDINKEHNIEFTINDNELYNKYTIDDSGQNNEDK